jgi:hypothetical protein
MNALLKSEWNVIVGVGFWLVTCAKYPCVQNPRRLRYVRIQGVLELMGHSITFIGRLNAWQITYHGLVYRTMKWEQHTYLIINHNHDLWNIACIPDRS